MVWKRDVENNIQILEGEYNSARSIRKKFLFSKLAVMELGGWTEESIDEIVENIYERKLSSGNNKKYINEKIKLIHGFKYNNFREAIVCLVGIINFDKIEKLVDPKVYNPFQSELNNLWQVRGEYAHTHSRVKALRYTPSVVRNSYKIIFNGLNEIEKVLKTIKYKK